MSSKTKNRPKSESAGKHDPDANGVVMYPLALSPERLAEFKAKATVLSRPQVIPLRDMPIGAAMIVTLNEIVPSFKKSIKQPLIIGALEDGRRVAIPFHRSIENTVAEENSDEETGYSLLHAGKVHLIQKVGTGASPNFKDQKTGKPAEFAIYEIAVIE